MYSRTIPIETLCSSSNSPQTLYIFICYLFVELWCSNYLTCARTLSAASADWFPFCPSRGALLTPRMSTRWCSLSALRPGDYQTRFHALRGEVENLGIVPSKDDGNTQRTHLLTVIVCDIDCSMTCKVPEA